jgi:ribonuclease-3
MNDDAPIDMINRDQPASEADATGEALPAAAEAAQAQSKVVKSGKPRAPRTADRKPAADVDDGSERKSAESSRRKTSGRKTSGHKTSGRKASPRVTTQDIEQRIGHTFADPSLLVTALTHVSALKSPGDRAGSYQRLEFLGDHVLGLVVSDMLFRTFPKADEGELSKRLADLVRRETCAEIARGLGLSEAIKLGAVGAGTGERLRKSVLGDICEAVIGAVFVDGGYAAAAELIERAWDERMRKPPRSLRDPKTVLQEWAQGRGLPTPTYREVERTGPHHDPRFRVAVDLPGLDPAEGVGGSKRIAEKAAAAALLQREGVAGGSDV